MIKSTELKHIALSYKSKKEADIFFNKILGINLQKSFTLEKKLADKIFNKNEDVSVLVYSNECSYFEIFISDVISNNVYEHICIKVKSKKELINNCKKYKIKPFYVKKGEKNLLFVRDFSNNLFEIIE